EVAASAISSASGVSNRCRVICLPAAVMIRRLRPQRSHVVAGGACRHPLAAAWCRIDACDAMQGRTLQMQIGFNAPTAGPLSAADNLTKIVVGGEAMGFDYATFSDHVVIPTAIAAEYPYSAS